MKIRKIIIISAIIQSMIAHAEDGRHCDSVLEHGARNFVSTLDFDSQKAYAYSKACNDQYYNSTGNTKLGIEAVIKKIPIGINFGSSNSKQQMQKWCKENESLNNQFNYSKYDESLVYGPSVDAWLNCKNAFSSGLKVATEISADNRSIAFQVTNDTTDKNVILRGVDISENSIACKAVTDVETIEADINTRISLHPKQSININCNRSQQKVVRDSQEIEILPAGSITINTKLKNYQISLPESSIVRLTDIQAEKIESKLALLNTSIEAVKTSTNKLENRKLCYCLDARHNGTSCAKEGAFTGFKGDGKTPDKIKIYYCEE